MRLYSKCVYTIVDDDALLRADQGSAPSLPVSEGKKWATARTWLQAASALGERVPIVLADAKYVHRWLGWAVLVDVDVAHIEQPPSETRYRFQELRPLLDHPRSEFLLLESGNPLSENDIRPYRRLRTPAFLSDLADLEAQPLLVDWLQRPEAVEHVFNSTFEDNGDRDAAREALKQAIEVADATAPTNWRAVLTPGRIRVFVGSESVVDVGNRAEEFLFWYSPDGDEEEGPPLIEVARFLRGPQFRRHLESLRATTPTGLPHADVVPRYLGAQRTSVAPKQTYAAGAQTAPADPVEEVAPSETGLGRAEALRTEGEASLGGFDPRDERDGRRRVLASLVQRQGQGAFRRELLRAYEGRCAITGWDVEDVLEAAHILPYRGLHTNHVSNGLLLRADLHVLFDLHLIEIDPDTYSVLVDPTLAASPYGGMHGCKLRLPVDVALQPSSEYFRLRTRSNGA